MVRVVRARDLSARASGVKTYGKRVACQGRRRLASWRRARSSSSDSPILRPSKPSRIRAPSRPLPRQKRHS